MPSACSGPAVTGPTQAGTTGPHSAACTLAPWPCSRAVRRKLTAAGALVNATASTAARLTASISRSSGVVSSGGTQR